MMHFFQLQSFSSFFTTAMIMMILLSVAVEASTPPACLIGAMSSFPNPADIKSICGKFQQEATSKIAQSCSSTTEHSAALNIYADTCYSEANIKVATNNSTTPKANPTLNTGVILPTSTSPASGSFKPKSPDSSVAKSPSPIPTTSVSSANLNYPLTAITVLIAGIIVQTLL
ncbi:hypothetical protein OnM2_02146 [Erysiphe neolycopersici]|uniref:Uncharacterized protein n=1 Tax=Erysiphe neolycopersici TaxID=212602 RepID=A0A420HNA1_9PEZI|nr:hypothetical protein OnM2_02146 [Erysiphe neolycopersici]